MASVSMSITLRDQISENFKVQLFKAYRVHNNIEAPINEIINHIYMLNDDFRCAVDLQKEWNVLYEKLKISFPDATAHSTGVYDLIKPDLISEQTSIGLIMNPTLGLSSNYTFYDKYATPVEEMSSGYGSQDYKLGIRNYHKDDVPVVVNDLDAFYAPYDFGLIYHRGYFQKEYSPHGSALLITDPKMCKMLSGLGELEQKVSSKLIDFKSYLEKITTLKKFVDEWPGAMSLIPEEYKRRMLKKAIKSTVQTLTPEQIIPDELKREMNEVILTNKLTGEV